MQEDVFNTPPPEGMFTDNKTHNAEPIENKVGSLLGTALMNHKDVAKNIKAVLLSGEVEPLELYVGLKRMDKVIALTISSQDGDKEIKELFKEKVRMALDGNKSVDIFGANLSLRATGTSYDYKDCKDSYLLELYKIKKEVDEKIKAREFEIKTALPPDSNTLGIRSKKIIQEGMPYFGISEDEFEETILPPVKYQGESIFCTFKDPKH